MASKGVACIRGDDQSRRTHVLYACIMMTSVSFLSCFLGAGVVTTRAHVHYVVTEYGIADLFGKNVRQRAYELIRIAHPDHRAELDKLAFKRLNCMPSP